MSVLAFAAVDDTLPTPRQPAHTSDMNPPPQHPDRARSHGRAASGDERRRVAIPRRSTKGPLESDVDDPLSPSLESTPRALSPARSEASPISPHHGVSLAIPDAPPKDFSFIQDPAAYHVLPASNVPPPFLIAPNVPPVTSPIESLLHTGHYRLAAIAAARNIVQAASPSDYTTLFHLLHVRLACLCLIAEHALAAQESKVLGDLNSAFYRHPLTNAHLVPWHLRLLAVRLAALGYGEWRKGIMGYYELAKECRENIIKLESAEDKRLWKTRLRDCGVRVANILIEMGELEGAGRHLNTLTAPETEAEASEEVRDIMYMEALVWLRIGDLRAARRCLAAASEGSEDSLLDGTLHALLQLANSEYSAAVSSFQALHEAHPDDAMVTQNLAVCLLYTGHIAKARALLTELADTTSPFRSMVFNLSTIYELCTERNRDRKLSLAEKLSSRKAEGDVGWEMSSADFKL